MEQFAFQLETVGNCWKKQSHMSVDAPGFVQHVEVLVDWAML